MIKIPEIFFEYHFHKNIPKIDLKFPKKNFEKIIEITEKRFYFKFSTFEWKFPIFKKNKKINIINGEILPKEKIFSPTDVQKIIYGSFNIFSFEKNKIEILNDIFSLIPLFYFKDKELLIVSSKVKIIAERLKKLNKKLTKNTQFKFLALTIGHALGDMTYYNEINYLLPATKITINKNKALIKNYYLYDLEKRDSILFSKIDQTFESLIENFSKNAGATISGGLDSRLILAHFFKKQKKIDLINYSFPNCKESKIPKKLSKRTNNNISQISFNITELLPTFHEYYKITEGFTDFQNSYLLLLREKQKNIKYLYNGFLGDATLGGTYLTKKLANPMEILKDIFTKNNLKVKNKKDLVTKIIKVLHSCSEEKINNLLKTHFSLEKLIELEIKRIESTYNITDKTDVFFLFLLLNRGLRNILYGVLSNRQFSEVICPFLSYSIMLELLKTKYEDLKYHKLYKKYFISRFPDFAKIENNNWGINLYHSKKIQRLSEYYSFLIQKLLPSKINSLFNQPIIKAKSYVDYVYWFYKSKSFRTFLNNDFENGKIIKHYELLEDYYNGN